MMMGAKAGDSSRGLFRGTQAGDYLGGLNRGLLRGTQSGDCLGGLAMETRVKILNCPGWLRAV